MAGSLHGSARTTPRVRAELQASKETSGALAKRYGLSRNTVVKWRARTSTEDSPMGPHDPHSTVLTLVEEAMIVEFRRRTLLPLDDGDDEPSSSPPLPPAPAALGVTQPPTSPPPTCSRRSLATAAPSGRAGEGGGSSRPGTVCWRCLRWKKGMMKNAVVCRACAFAKVGFFLKALCFFFRFFLSRYGYCF